MDDHGCVPFVVLTIPPFFLFVHDLLANMAYQKLFNIRNTTGTISEAGTAYRYGAAEFIPVLV